MSAKIVRNVFLLGVASASNVAMTALQSLLLGHLLNVEMFGITRTATAYMVFLTMFGHFTLHNALAASIVNARNDTEVAKYILHAIALVAGISTIVAVVASLVIAYTGWWTDSLRLPLIIVVSSLPAVCITMVLNACLEALGAYSTYMWIILLTGFAPLAILVPLTWMWGLDGWLAGRLISSIFLVVIALIAIRVYLKATRLNLHYFKTLFAFARIQIFSGLLSLTLLSADVMLLEALTHNLKVVANYGLALLFYGACAIVPTTLGRVYFRKIAPSAHAAERHQIELMAVAGVLGILGAIVLYYAGPYVIGLFFGDRYQEAKLVLRVMSLGLTFNFLWTVLSTINIATSRPRASVVVSTVGASVGLALLLLLIPQHQAIGAAWAMVLAYASGVAVGLWQLRKSLSLPGPLHAS